MVATNLVSQIKVWGSQVEKGTVILVGDANLMQKPCMQSVLPASTRNLLSYVHDRGFDALLGGVEGLVAWNL